ncbi:hypothetical protein LCGC14_3009590 [marine sediment metagenome]|uniref:DUF7352 domain-containing protein n=1 Tax=marine sediment metagenome TaxID=412755 RepID=A0A0F8ZPU4_9ZZZZ|nr:hypothetical protein [Phycisphaerales bacterium]
MSKNFVVHKEVIQVVDGQDVCIKGLIAVLSFAVQHNHLVMYFVRDIESEKNQSVDIVIKGTGHVFDVGDMFGYRFMGSHIMFAGELVWHVWARLFENETIARLGELEIKTE